jgi:HD-like signal output (HDOD) protein
MDFGIAARVAVPGARAGAADAAAGRPGVIVGTAGYISPEAARGEAPVPAMDVFAAGVMLAELLSGEPPMRESDPQRALQRVLEEDLQLPAAAEVDEVLRGVVQRALARDGALRHDGARALHAALSAWLQGGEPPVTPAPAAHGTLDFLLRRMRRKSDFPALSQSVVRIQRLAASDTETLGRLAEAILEDVALTHKLLRMVNSAHFRLAAGGGVGTVSRAVALVGFAGVRNMALSLLLLEHMNDKQHAAHLRQEFVRALMASTLAAELAGAPREAEEAYLASLFQNLGRLLTEFYFPEEALQIRQWLPAEGAGAAQREATSARVLGLGFGELGLGVARQWGLPELLMRAMRGPEGAPPARLLDPGAERLHWLGRGANEMTDALLGAEGAAQTRELLAVAEAFSPALGLPPRRMLAAAEQARRRLATLTQAMGLSVARDSPARRLLSAAPPAMGSDAVADAPTVAGAPAMPDVAPTPMPATRKPAAHGAAALDALAAGLAQVSAAAPRARLDDVLTLALGTLHQALGLRCAVFALRDPASQALRGRCGVGPAAAQLSRALQVPLAGGQGADLFAAQCARGADTLIADTRDSAVAARLPDWYRRHAEAHTFLLLPLMLKGAPVGLLYGDKAAARSLVIGEAEWALLRQLRDQLVGAFTSGRR